MREGWILVLVVALGLVLSGIGPADRLTWVLEVFPVAVGLPLAIATAKRFPLTPLLSRLLTLHALILLVGGHYTYAEVPAGAWVQELCDLSRNPYDRLGHLAQGFVPAILVRELLLRTSPLRPGRWLFVLVTGACVASSALYELIEWWGALLLGESAEAFLGTQGDPWDTQWDMFLALVGATAAQLLLARIHDRALSGLRAENSHS